MSTLRRYTSALAGALALCLALSGHIAEADTLDPGNTLTLNFTITPNNSDFLVLQLSPFTQSGTPSITTQLYANDILLGTYVTSPATFNAQNYFQALFESPTSVYTSAGTSPAVVDFSPLNAGTDNAKFLLTVSGGTLDNLDIPSSLYLTDANSCSLNDECYAPVFNTSYVDYSIDPTPLPPPDTAAPEPASVGLLCVAAACLLSLGLFRRRKFAAAQRAAGQ